MRVSILKNDRIKNLNLPTQAIGSFWITDFDDNGNEENLICIEGNGTSWILTSNDEYTCIENNTEVASIELREYNFYDIKNKLENKNINIYCSPIIDNTYQYYPFSVSEISISNNPNSNICYKNLKTSGFKIVNLNNGSCQLIKLDLDINNRIYVNNNFVTNKYNIYNGDIIFSEGLKIIFLYLEGQAVLQINNPFNSTIINLNKIEQISGSLEVLEDDGKAIQMDLYYEDDYFHKRPKFVYNIEKPQIKIDPPPQQEKKQDTSVIMTIGPMLTMSLTSLVMGYVAVNNVINKNGEWTSSLPSLVICFAMLCSTILWPSISKKISKKISEKNESVRQKKYGAYIETIRKTIFEEMKEQRSILINAYPSIIDSENIIINKQLNLWGKRIEDNDFMSVSLGSGRIPLQIDISYPDDHFSLDDDTLKSLVKDLKAEPKELVDSPVVYSFKDNNISAIIGHSQIIYQYTNNLLVQLLSTCSYDDMKLVIFTNAEKEHLWTFSKILPHIWSDDNTFRFFSSNNDESKEVCYYLERIYNSRKESEDNKKKINQRFLIITDSFKTIRNYDFIKNILESETDYGFSILILNDRISNLPDSCTNFIKVSNPDCELIKSDMGNDTQKFTMSIDTIPNMYTISKILANIPIEIDSTNEGKIPSKLGFLEMFDVGKVEQLNTLNRWKSNPPIQSLNTPIGIGKSGEKISLDLHEKFHGPHGLIAGMTGSGKSELIITYILSMAVNYHPYEVQFILIDYKGGGLAGAFQNNVTGVKLPHLIGTMTNLDTNEIKRCFASVESELKRRQTAFNKAREVSGESTIDIYKYQKMYRDHIVDEPVSYLFIIADEFAELKTQQPEFMEQLISTARIGRSLGVHLILATQKPSGVVDPQIWSNTRFRICLRVQEKSDSVEVIKTPEAAMLKQIGRFYLQVGYNEIFALGQSAWTGGKYIPSEKIVKNVDSSLLFINNIGYVTKSIENKKKIETSANNGEELNNILKYIVDIAASEKIICDSLWKEKIPDIIIENELSIKYNYKSEKYIINPIIGEYDEPSKQAQHLLTVPFSKEGNAIVYGVSGSGKENLLTTLIYSCMEHHTAEEINIYIVDYGAELLKCFNNSPIVGDIIYSNDEERLKNLFKMISTTIESRKKLFADYNGDYVTYCNTSGKNVPNIIVIINNYEAYQENHPELDDEIVNITRECNRYGIFFLITCTTPNGMRFKLKQNFSQLFALQQNNDDDYAAILGNVKKNYPSKIFGRGIIKLDEVHEFQTAYVCDKDNVQTFVKEKSNEYKESATTLANKIPVLPEKIIFNDVKDTIDSTGLVAIGMSKSNLDIVSYDFDSKFTTLIASQDIISNKKLIESIIQELLYLNKNSVIVVDAEELEIKKFDSTKYQYITSNLGSTFTTFLNYINETYDKYVNSNYDKSIFKDKVHITCIIIGIDSYKSKVGKDDKLLFGDIFEKGKDLGLINYILVDSIDKIKKIELDSWYKSIINTNEGIWIGNGINDQFSIKTTVKIPELKEELKENYCFVIKKGKPDLIQYVESDEEND